MPKQDHKTFKNVVAKLTVGLWIEKKLGLKSNNEYYAYQSAEHSEKLQVYKCRVWTGLVELRWVGLGWGGLGWVGLGKVGLSYERLG